MKKVLSWILAICLLCGVMLQMAVPAYAKPTGEKAQTIETMNGLLLGITADMLNSGDVEAWSNKTINQALFYKVLCDPYTFNPWLAAMGVPTEASSDGYIHVPGTVVNQLTMDAYGREFVHDPGFSAIKISGDEVLIQGAAGVYTPVVVQDYIQRGNYYIAVGCVADTGGGSGKVEGYFQAVIRKNADSMYGMTLVSLEEISSNQSFANVSAEASSVLSGGNYKAANVLDGKQDTAWVEGMDGTGAGEFIELVPTDGAVLSLCAIEIDPGYHKNDSILTQNGWPTKILIETDDDVTLEQYCYNTETQVFLFETPVQVQWIRITILEAQAGSKYSDTCISEIRLKGIDTEKYFQNLEIDLPEEPQGTDAPAPEATAPLPAPDATVPEDQPAPEETIAPEEVTEPEAETEAEDAEAEEEEEENIRGDDKEIIQLGGIGDWDITGFLEENLLLVILIGAGSLVAAAGIGMLIVWLRKKK